MLLNAYSIYAFMYITNTAKNKTGKKTLLSKSSSSEERDGERKQRKKCVTCWVRYTMDL